jgi:hypothetical protein
VDKPARFRRSSKSYIDKKLLPPLLIKKTSILTEEPKFKEIFKNTKIEELAYGSEGFLNFFDVLFSKFEEKDKAHMNYYC